MESKTCIFVGNGKFNKSYGELIDSYDHVYRFNRFTTKDEFVDLVGTKCTHWIVNQKLATDDRDLINMNIEKYKNKYIDLQQIWVLTNSPINLEKLKKLKEQHDIFDFSICDPIYTGHKNSTGISTINFFLEKYDEIHLVGFDFGKSNHYWVSKNPSASDVPGRHNWSAEKDYITNLVKLGKVRIING